MFDNGLECSGATGFVVYFAKSRFLLCEGQKIDTSKHINDNMTIIAAAVEIYIA